ncbi:DASS family sodium-coupled anion symporter [Candidatus Fermentibacteria bacterium]|nr:DASS family sodium-coupled anion symporter [Candidatus Fermentibacteria bacterium]
MKGWSLRRVLLGITGILLAVLAYLMLGSLPPRQRIMASIFILTVFLWITEIIPIFVTAVLSAFLCALLLGQGATLFGAQPLPASLFFNPFANTVIVLMFGGFVLARVFSRNYLDEEFCDFILARLGNKPQVVLLGIMGITAVMSMWMSNTATTAIMVATVLPAVRGLRPGSNLAKALMLGIPFAANIGGIATPIGTPPNAIALGLLAERGYTVSFFTWMIAGFPLMVVVLLITFGLTWAMFKTTVTEFSLKVSREHPTANRGIVYTTFFATVLLWLTDALHHIPSAVVALVPMLVFSVAGLFSKEDLRLIAWDILLLIGGGLALGAGIKETGLADTIVQYAVPSGFPKFGVIALFSFFIALIATFMSNTAAATIVLPIAVSLSGQSPMMMMITVAICTSYGMALPISTPPNAIAYGSEMIQSKDMFRLGALVSIVAVIVTVAWQALLFLVFPGLAVTS